MRTHRALCALGAPTLLLTGAAQGQIVEDFESGNPDDWGFDYDDPTFGITSIDGTVIATGGNPGAYLEFLGVTSTALPVNFLWARTFPVEWAGNFRTRNVQGFGFDYRHNLGFPNFGFPFQLILGDDRGTPLDLTDDVMAVIYTGVNIQVADQTWHTGYKEIPAGETTLPTNWSIHTMPLGTNPYVDDDDAWNSIVQEVDYVSMATAHPSLAVFGTVNVDFDNLLLDLGFVGTPYCFGDGNGSPCPCANDNDGSVAGAGCANGQYASGVLLTASGNTSLANDTLVLHGEFTEHDQFGLFFQADNSLEIGQVWGDGLRCAGGELKRLGTAMSDSMGYSDTTGYGYTISSKAGNINAGETKYYQLWYRNPFNSPCANDFNTSNGLGIIWAP